MQQFWNTMKYDEKTGVYSCQVDEQWFVLIVDLLKKALAITLVNPAHPFELPPSGNTVIDFVNELGYPEPVEIERLLAVTNPVTQSNVDHAELLWEEFTQGIQTFFSHKASHKASLKDQKKKVTPLLIPYGRFSKVIIYCLASKNNIHRHPDSAVHHTGDDFILGNLKFVPKGETVEVALEKFDLKSALFKHMNKNRTANRNPANYHLYHALMEALIADEDAMDKEVKNRVKDHKRKHDSDDDEIDDDDEGPSAGSNQGKSTKRRRHDPGAFGSAQPHPKDDEQNVVIDSSMHRSEPESGHSEHSSNDVSKQDEGHVSDLEDTDNAHIPKVTAATWFKPIPEDERPSTPEPEWTIPPNDFPEPENN
ncbi:hypothetical protein Tco_0618263, partial [Tanacetum coccineum]